MPQEQEKLQCVALSYQSHVESNPSQKLINVASGSSLRVGEGLRSCTANVEIAQAFELGGQSVTLIDTPGFDDTTKSDTEVLRMIAAFLATLFVLICYAKFWRSCISICNRYEGGQKLTGLIYIHRISDNRVGGISARNLRMFRKLCGEKTMRNVVVVTNMWGEVNHKTGETRESELRRDEDFFKPILESGALIVRHDNTHKSAHDIIRHILKNQPLSLQVQRELVDEKKEISQTEAGAELNRELMQQIERHKTEIRFLQEEMQGSWFVSITRQFRVLTDGLSSLQRPLELETKKQGKSWSKRRASSRRR